MKNKYIKFSIGIVAFLAWSGQITNVFGRSSHFAFEFLDPAPLPPDSPEKKESNESFVQKTEPKSQFLPTPKNVVREVVYDIKTNKYLITEKVNGRNIKPPMYLTFEEYMALVEKEEFAKIAETKSANAKDGKAMKDALGKAKGAKDQLGIKTPLDGLTEGVQFKLPENGIFGDGPIEIKPQGNLDIQMGYQHSTIRNPALSPYQQTQGLIDFDMGMNINLNAKIGDKFQNTLRYNNQSSFGFEGQQIKLAYNGKEDEIIRNFEAGDVNFEIPTQLIKSAQSLWGIKSELQFGKLNIKTALSQQRSSRQSKTIENGTETQTFEIAGDQYDQFKHFFLCHMFRDNYEKALENYPMKNSPYYVQNVEVWVSNRNIQTQSVRDVVAFQDLGENKPYSKQLTGVPNSIASNKSNDLYDRIKLDNSVRTGSTALQSLTNPATYKLVSYQDFEKGFLRKLNPNEFKLDSQLGYISLNSTLQANDILAVSFQYVYKGDVYQVGDLSRDIVLPDSTSSEPSRLLFLKTLKSTNINPSFPMWDLMMKNVYSLNAFQVNKDNFRLDIFYNDPGGGLKRYLPRGNLQNEPLTRTLNLDRLNLNNEPYPDGVFDFVPNITIWPNSGKVFFPVLEPFGSHLKKKLESVGNASMVKDFVFQYLYDSTQFLAQQYPELNRFIIKGTFQSATNKRISLGLNTPQGSVYVTMNGQRLTEGQDYIVEYGSLGYIELMDHVMSSGGKIQIEYENNIAFGLQTRNFMGLRAEYRFNERFKIGSTYEKLSERPFNNKITYGEDPISNQILGFDISYASNLPILTRWLDALPFYKTSEMSTIKAYGEFAHLIPGHFQSIGDAGTIYLDDFEGTSISYNFGNPSNIWRLASTPSGAKDEVGNELFKESKLYDSIVYGYNRAKMSVYNVSSVFYFDNNVAPKFPPSIREEIYQRMYRVKDIYPFRQNANFTDLLQTLDISFNPRKRGPYNFEISPSPGIFSKGVNADGSLKDPKTRWAGIQRAIENTNFETNNIEFIQFWLLDPFINNTNNSGDLYFNLGYVSEDVLKDSRLMFEHGLVDKNGSQARLIAESRWSWVPKTLPLINAFDNNTALRPLQDIGLDGASDAEERSKFASFLTQAQTNLNPDAYTILNNDPSSDNFRHFLDPVLVADPKKTIVTLYQDFSGVENNTPVGGTSAITQSSYITPDNEDINRDNTLNENEAYFQYRVKLTPGMDVGSHPYIVSKTVSTNVVDPNTGKNPVWYQFRIPIKEYNHRVGQIGDFRNIQFVRMFLTNFEDSVIVRMNDLAFVRNQWRKYTGSIQTPTDFIARDNGEPEYFNVGAVSLEENGNKRPSNYVTPVGITREVGLNASSNPIQLNEQSLRLSFCNLKDGDAKACFKNIDFDFRQYKTIKLFAHADNDSLAMNYMKDDEISCFIRLGSDFKDNYYEYEIPLKVTPPGNYNNSNDNDKRKVWPDVNQMVIQIRDLVNAKFKRNKDAFPTNTPYVFKTTDNRNITIVGNPDLGLVKVAMIGIRNRTKNDKFNFSTSDDGLSKCGEVWVNELRLEGLNEEGGSAAIANVEVKLADLGSANFSSSLHTVGYGQIYERVNERKRDDYFQYNFNTTLQLGKLLPKFLGLQLPFYLQTGQGTSLPRFDPFSNDIYSNDQVEAIRASHGSDSASEYLNSIQTIDRRFGFNFTNVRYMPAKPSTSVFPFSPRFFTLSYAFNSIQKSSPFIKDDWMRTYEGKLDYNYGAQPVYIEPLKKLIKSKSKGWDWLKATHINFIPNSISFSNKLDRTYGIFQQRQLPNEVFTMPDQYIKSFTWNRDYVFDYNPFRTLNVNFTAQNQARIDEPQGAIDTRSKEDSIFTSLKNFGRTTNYSHALSAKYSIPLNKISFLSFINSNIRYNSNYNWTTGPQIFNTSGELIQSPQGNVISNGQTIGTSANLKMNKLYSQIPFLKNVDIDHSRNSQLSLTKEQRESRDENVRKDRIAKKNQIDAMKADLAKLKQDKKDIKKNDSIKPEDKKRMLKELKKKIKDKRFSIRDLKKLRSNTVIVPGVAKFLVQPILAVREIDASYDIDNQTTLNGYTGKPKYFGTELDKKDHLDPSFVLGEQPGLPLFAAPDKYARMRWLEEMAGKGFLTKDSTFNMPMTQSNAKIFKARMVLEPWKNIRINLNWESDYTQRFSEYFVFNQLTGQFEHRNPLESGSYTYSDINLLTSFKKIENSGVSQNVSEMDKNRQQYAEFFHQVNPNSLNQKYIDPLTGLPNNNYWYGYGPLQQDVLINSFLTTYRGEKASGGEKNLSPFSKLPLPNWNINYNGLTQYPFFKKVFENFSIRHGYSSKTTISNFNSEFRYEGGGQIKNPVAIDSLSNNYIPYYFIPNVGFSESFQPLLGVEFTLKNKMNFKFEYKSSRQVSMSLIDYQLTENLNSGITFGYGFQTPAFIMPFFAGPDGKEIEIKKGARISLDVTYSNNFIVNHKVGQDIHTPVGGAIRLMINPKIDCQVSDKLNLQLFYNYVYNEPRIALAFPTINGAAGMKMSMSIAP